MADVGGEFDAREYGEGERASQLREFFLGPGTVVLREANPVESTCTGRVNQLADVECATRRQRSGVAVQVDQHR